MTYQGKLVWLVIEAFDRTTEDLVSETRIDEFIEPDYVVGLVGARSIDDLVQGGWRVEGQVARQLERILDCQIDDGKYEHFVAVTAPDRSSALD